METLTTYFDDPRGKHQLDPIKKAQPRHREILDVDIVID